MTPSEWIACYEERASRAVAVASANMEAAVPSCPGWTGRDLLRHVGITPNGLRITISTPMDSSVPDMRKVRELNKSVPTDDESLIQWAYAEIEGWADHLRSLDPHAPAFTMTADKTMRYWIRHSAVETTVHLWDVEGISGSRTEIPADLGADGLDELLLLVDLRRFRKDLLPTRSLRVAPTNTQRTWTFPGTDDPASADDEVQGQAEQFMLRLYGRQTGTFTGAIDTLETWASLPPI
jgi:uncharacterized protein (TIGR03083 family)